MRLAPRALCSAAGAAWRESFPLGGHDVARWFPGHMAKGLKKMQSSLKLVDCIIEVHDARISFAGCDIGTYIKKYIFSRNRFGSLDRALVCGLKGSRVRGSVAVRGGKHRGWCHSSRKETLGIKPHLLVLNKMDLADLKEKQKIIRHLEREGLKNVIFTNCIKDENIKQVIPMVTELVGNSYRYHRGENVEFCIMVIGVPNVGKSSLINSLRRQHLRKGKAARVGGEPGITRAVMSRIQVSERPLMFLLDTPGVLAPRIESVETGLKLALCGTVLDHLVGEDTLADYLLYTLNRHQRFGYVQHYGLGEACDDVASVLKRVAIKLGKTQKVKVLTGTGNVNVIQPNYSAAARDFLRTFRSGLLGPVMLDRDILQSLPAADPSQALGPETCSVPDLHVWVLTLRAPSSGSSMPVTNTKASAPGRGLRPPAVHSQASSWFQGTVRGVWTSGTDIPEQSCVLGLARTFTHAHFSYGEAGLE
ncbi:hypothetical protein QTO34_005801 [Cnephaeus nilssonii]|uniref:Mitochondrial ribosome-associated GTPase 1 n=1 Tax=Cnephaeus nilssonii TaxID=3371016 RepID=A0AA40LJ06_CNENI|nr:hypothetical protein QTO34_005801 [Eptesicus nilssonii]